MAKMQILGSRVSWCASSTGWTKQLGAQLWFRKAPTLRLRSPQHTNSALKSGLQCGRHGERERGSAMVSQGTQAGPAGQGRN